MRMKCSLFLMILSLGINSLTAREIHVSIDGNNLRNGTIAKPLRTIQAAADIAMPGDIIVVHAGVYREQVVPPRGGNSETERIVYQAAKGERVEIKGSELITGWQPTGNDTWMVTIPNRFFGNFNPYSDIIHGDWFAPNNRLHHTGAVYLNGSWLMEAAKKEEVTAPADPANMLWWAEVDSTTTTIWAQFKGADPNHETVEINVRQKVFYPDKPFINFITVSGFIMQHAATNWAPPTAEQMGLIGTHWSRGWIIENNIIQYSRCVGISLGKYGDEYDNTSAESAEGYVGTINRALAFGWNKGTIGSHIVRNNTIAFCEQTGIVGSMGCAFSIIEGNTIHDIHVHRLFGGAEMAGIKFHGAVDVLISRNNIYNTNIAVWLDWMAQGVQVHNNLLHGNGIDLFLEVDHGPMLVYNNLMLSSRNLLMNAKGAAFAHNLFAGTMDVVVYDSRLTPYLKPHSTFVEGLHDNQGGDIQFINNLFVSGGDASQYARALLPVHFTGNVFTKGSVRPVSDKFQNKFGELTEEGKVKFTNMKPVDAVEENSIIDTTFNAEVKLVEEKGVMMLLIDLNKNWLNQTSRKLVNTGNLGKAMIPGLPFENLDGSPVAINTDFEGKPRNPGNISPGPFEIQKSGQQRIRVW